MTGTLRIQLRQTLERGEARAGAVARIARLGEGETPRPRQVVIPASHSQYREIEVEPGEYMVEALLPSGSLLREQVSIRDGEESSVHLDSSSQYEWLGWQALVGQRRHYEKSAAPPPHVETFRLPAAMRASEWASLAKLASSRATPSTRSVVGALGLGAGTPSQPERDDGAVALHAWDHGPGGGEGVVAVIERGPLVELVMVPVTWDFRHPVRVELAVARDPAIPLSVAIGDPELGGLIGYLGAGSLAAAQAMLEPGAGVRESAERGLYEKGANPFGAAAAGCVLVLNEATATRQPWDAWIENLAGMFPRLADGAILLAARRLALARTQADLDGVRTGLADAMERGIPVFAAAARILVETMTTVVGDQSVETSALEGEDGFGALRRVMLRLQPRQAVTVLRFGGLPRAEIPALPAKSARSRRRSKS